MRAPSRSAGRAAAGAALALFALGGYALAVEPRLRLRTKRYAFTPRRWTPGLRLRIAALADWHAGPPHMTVSRMRRIIRAANSLEPDLIVLLGDYAGTDYSQAPLPWRGLVREFTALRAPLGVYAVLGNHDWWRDRAAQRARRGPTLAHRAFADSGILLLENDAIRLAKDGNGFWLLGLGDQLAFRRDRGGCEGADDLPGTLAKITDDAPALLLAHEPDIFARVPPRVSVTFSGHTHGGQVRLFGWSPVVPSRFGNRYAYGHVVEGDRHLIVSGGLGTVSAGLAPVRFGVPPEIVLVELGRPES